MCSVAIKIPDEVLYDTKMSDNEALDFARKSVAVSYYTKAGVSLGYCAQIAGMTKEDFIKYLGEQKISIFRFESEEELEQDLKNA